MYQDLKERYWWYGMKKDVATHVAFVIHVKESKLSIKGQQDYFNL
jgi:hypothetical protein